MLVYANVAGVWLSGVITHRDGEACIVRLVSGLEKICFVTELLTESPKLKNPKEWPV